VFEDKKPQVDLVFPNHDDDPEWEGPMHRSGGVGAGPGRVKWVVGIGFVAVVAVVAAFFYLRWMGQPMAWQLPPPSSDAVTHEPSRDASAAIAAPGGDEQMVEEALGHATSAAGATARDDEISATDVKTPTRAPDTHDLTDMGVATVVEKISWTVENGETSVTIRGNAPFASRQVAQSVLVDPPRCVIRIFAITRAFEVTSLPSTAPRLTGVRIGHHFDRPDPQLHVVLDLSSSAVTAAPVEVQGNTIVVRLGGE
jgi:hypothetical protein